MPKKLTKKKSKAKDLDFIDFLNAKYGTRDSDNDGISDEVEKLIGTDPFNADTDQDGMNDLEEIRVGRNPLGPGDWRDWFVPHEGNNYHPHVLHPKRVLFYATAAVAMKVLVVAFALGLPLTAWLSPDLLKTQAEEIIKLTNELRIKIGVPALTENQALNRAAYAKASDMILQQYFAHVGPDKKSLADWLKAAGYRYTVAGENLALGFSSASEVLAAWQKSRTHYANLIDQDFTQIGVGAVSGPYQGEDTQLVAQYFGASVPAVTPLTIDSVEPAADKAKVLGQVSLNNRQLVATKTAVPAAKTLVKPLALNFNQASLTNQTPLALKIFAPGAASVRLVGKNISLPAEPADKDNNEWRVALPLEPGKNVFYLVAQNAGAQLASDNYEIIFDSEPPLVDADKTKLFLDLPQGTKEAVARAAVYLSADAAGAQLAFSDYRLDLQLVDGAWVGQTIIADRRTLEPIVPPELTVKDEAGNSKVYSLTWANLSPISSTRTARYWWLRANPTPEAAKLFGLSDWVYRLLLFGSVMSLSLAVGVEIKKQRPKLIISTAGLIVLLIILLIF